MADDGLRSGLVEGNVAVIDKMLSVYQTELETIRTVRAQAGVEALAGALGEEANQVFGLYAANIAGRDRRTVDPWALLSVCDELWEVARQMDELRAEVNLPQNDANLDIVVDPLLTYGREYELVVAARAAL